MRLPTVCLCVPALAGTVAMPQNDEKCLRWFMIVWLHLLQHQKGDMRLVFMIPPSCLLGLYQAYFQYIQPYRILLFLARISQWSSLGICVSYPV